MEPGDTFEWLAAAFDYESVADLAERNGVHDLATLRGDIRLPDWVYVYAVPGDTLARLDERFGLRPGSARTVGRVHHPDPGIPFPGEIVALPLGSR